jgi:DNA-binding NarL/FixJ family response regulator
MNDRHISVVSALCRRFDIEDALGTHFDLLGHAASLGGLVDSCVELVPDVVVIEWTPSSTDLLQRVLVLGEQAPATKVVVVATADHPGLVQLVRSGAFAVITDSTPVPVALDIIRGATRGESALSADVAAAVLAEMRHWVEAEVHPAFRPPTLTRIEERVLEDLAVGRSAADVAVTHDVTARLVGLHVGYAVSKLQRHLAEQRRLADHLAAG